jgi:hypothetical protein
MIRVSQTHDGLTCPHLACAYCGKPIEHHKHGVAAFDPERAKTSANAPLYVLHNGCQEPHRKVIRRRGSKHASLDTLPLELLPVLVGLNIGIVKEADWQALVRRVKESEGTRR